MCVCALDLEDTVEIGTPRRRGIGYNGIDKTSVKLKFRLKGDIKVSECLFGESMGYLRIGKRRCKVG